MPRRCQPDLGGSGHSCRHSVRPRVKTACVSVTIPNSEIAQLPVDLFYGREDVRLWPIQLKILTKGHADYQSANVDEWQDLSVCTQRPDNFFRWV